MIYLISIVIFLLFVLVGFDIYYRVKESKRVKKLRTASKIF